MTTNEDFLFAQEALALGYVTEAQVDEARLLQRRMADELHLDERLAVLLVKRGFLAEDQARRVEARTRSGSGRPGEIVGYRLLEVVGRGAMGTVYRALHLGLNREVAIKILRQDLAGDRTQIERLKAEAAMLASLDHPNIVRALDAGESNGFPYVVMEFVEGETLRDRMRREGRLPEKEALAITRALADALERARRMGVVHRDVKPGNILLTKAGEPKLMDLGLAKGPIDMGLTQHGATVGTPQYIAPEQAVDPRKADTRSDIYSLGATLYAMLAGRPPFDGETLAEILTKVLYESPTPVRALRPEVSPETGYLVDRMMLRDPTLRYRTPAQVVADIDRLEHGASILPPGFSGNWEAFLLRRKVRRTAIVGGLTIVAAVLVAFGVKAVVDWRDRDRVRDRLQEEIGRVVPGDLAPTAGRTEVEVRLREAEALLREAREAEPDGLPQLERRVRGLREEVARFERLVAFTRDRIEPTVENARYAEAVTAYEELLKKEMPVAGPAQHALREQLGALKQRSDDAIEDQRRLAFKSEPRDLADLLGDLERWSSELGWRFASTGKLREERQRAEEALDAARGLERRVRQELSTLDDAWLSGGVASLRLGGLHADERARRGRAFEELAAQRASLVGSPRYVTAPRLEELVRAPFDARLREVNDAVAQAWKEVAVGAERSAEAGDPKAGMAALEAFAVAAAADGEFPREAQAARAALQSLEERTRGEREAATRVLDEVVSGAVDALRVGDAKAVAGLVERARAKGAGVQTAARELDALSDIPARYDLLYERALVGLEAHVGSDEKKWIDSLAFRGGTVETRCEILEVTSRPPGFAMRSHRGNSLGPRVQRSLADELFELERLAGLSPEVPEEAAAVALHGFASLPSSPDDVPRDYDAHRMLRDRLARAAPLLAPLLDWAERRTQALSKEVEALEEQAAYNFREGQDTLARGKYDLAEFHLLTKLLSPPLSYTAFVRQREAQIRADLKGLDGRKDADLLSRLLLGATMARREPRPDGGIDVDLRFTFDRYEQLENFTSGWARLVGSNAGAVVTPGQEPDLSLELHPGSDEVTKDRPLVLPTCFDPAFEMSMQFTLVGKPVPLFLGIDLDGVQVGILSDDPLLRRFPADVPRLDSDGASPPKHDVYGRGRGVMFRAERDFGDPARWAWPDGHQGRHFVPPEISKKGRKDRLEQEWFAFENRDRPYRVKFTRHPDGRVRLDINDREVHSASGEAFRTARPDGKLAILVFTRCVIDDLQLTGRIPAAWLAARKKTAPPGLPGTRDK